MRRQVSEEAGADAKQLAWPYVLTGSKMSVNAPIRVCVLEGLYAQLLRLAVELQTRGLETGAGLQFERLDYF